MGAFQGFLAFLWLGCTLAMFYFIVRALRKKESWKRAGLAFLGGFASVAVAAMLDPKGESPSTSQIASQPVTPQAAPKLDPQVAQLKAQLAKAQAEQRLAEQKAAKAQQEAETAKSQAQEVQASQIEQTQDPELDQTTDSTSGSGGINAQHITSDNYFGCSDKDDFKKAVQFAVEKDAIAFQDFLGTRLTTGDCTTFKAGQAVFVDDTSLLSGMVKVRPEGDTNAYWTNLEAVH